MERNFIMSCESTIDLDYYYITNRNVSIINYTYAIDGEIFIDDMNKDQNKIDEFFELLKMGKMPSTSQINKYQYIEYFTSLLKQGKDVFHLVFGSGMTPSIKNALEAKEEVLKNFPNRRLEVIDSTCSSGGYGLLLDYCVDLFDEGKTIEEIVDFVENNKRNVQHQFFATDLKFFKRSGRVSWASASIGTILGICPIMRLNYDGKIVAYSKVRGKKKALLETYKVMESKAKDGLNYTGKCFISHSNAYSDALLLKQMVEANFKNIEVKITQIGRIISSHCGPGTVALFFLGEERIK